jgi:hypothetical protein
MAEEAPVTRRDIEQKIVALAWKDEDFRRKFLADPKQQFEERLGTKLPVALRMAAWQEDENNLHFVIPQKPNVDIAELSDEDLEKIAGGIDVAVSLVTIALGIVAASGVGSFFGGKAIAEKVRW